jgi:pilus assembly protein CpaE
MSQEHILIVDDSKIIITKLSAVLVRLGYRVSTHHNPIEALKWLRVPGNLPDLIVLDVSMPDMTGYEFIQHIRADPVLNFMPIILLTGNTNLEDKVAGFEAGADDYLAKTVSSTELDLRIKVLLSRARPLKSSHLKSQAHVTSVFSLRGGVGTSSIAVNLAVALAQLWEIEVPLMDLSLKNAHCPLMLNIKPKHTLSSVTDWEDSVLEAETIEKLMTKHKSGVKLLSACETPEEAELVTLTSVDRVWPYLRARYPLIVIDAGSQLIEPVLTMLERSHTILLMLAPDLASLKAAADARRIFKQLGYGSEHVMPILNWIYAHSSLPEKFIESYLSDHVSVTLPYAGTELVEAINSGKPAMISAPKSKLSKAITTLAYELGAGPMKAYESDTPSELLAQTRKLVKAT